MFFLPDIVGQSGVVGNIVFPSVGIAARAESSVESKLDEFVGIDYIGWIVAQGNSRATKCPSDGR